MHIHGEVCKLANGLDDARSEGNIGDEPAVHDINVDPICATLDGLTDLISQLAEICGKNGGGNDIRFHVSCLTTYSLGTN